MLVAHVGSIEAMAGLAVELRLKIHQLDVISDYLDGQLSEKIFMKVSDYVDKFLKLITSENSDMHIISRKAEKIHEPLNEVDKVSFLNSMV